MILTLLVACRAVPPGELVPQTQSTIDPDVPADSAVAEDTSPPAFSGDPAAEEVCSRWNASRSALVDASWSGDRSSCDPGDMDAAGRSRALGILNTYRVIAGQPEVTTDAALDADSQSCALMEDIHGTLDHYPTSDWSCYSTAGDDAAGKSNIATAPAVTAMDMYMQDWGNETTLGHRRWLLSDQLGPIGIGSTDEYSCVYVVGGTGAAQHDWVAWPPDGYFPAGAIDAGGYDTIDETGWSLQSDTLDLSDAVAEITHDGAELPIVQDALLQYYGSSWALKMTPDGWETEAGETYHVSVTGSNAAIDYDVQVVDCDGW